MDFYTLITNFGWPIGSLIFALLLLYFDKIVSGSRYREVCRQRDKLLVLALRGQSKAWEAVDVAKALTDPKKSESDEEA